MIGYLRKKCVGYCRRRMARFVARKPLAIRIDRPIVSFTFDDFPRSALYTGGAMLNRAGVAATYYASLGLMGQDAPTGRIFSAEDIPSLLEQGHELGCHTFAHCHSWETEPNQFEASIRKNRDVLRRIAPSVTLKSFAYPISTPRPSTKAKTGALFECCRCGGQKPNIGVADLNQVFAFFLERSRDDFATIRAAIDENQRERGWLVFATHDISDDPTPYGCRPALFSKVLDYVLESGSRVLPVAGAVSLLRTSA